MNFTIVDQMDALEKRASFLLGRQSSLDQAPESDFALVLWNGQEKVRKFPISSPQDVLDSHEALEKNASMIPDEILKVARVNVEMAHRDHFGSPLYEDLNPEGIVTNSIFIDEIDQHAFEEKKRGFEKVAHHDPSLYLTDNRFILETQEHVKTAAYSLEKGVVQLQGRDRAEASRRLIKRAQALGVELSAEISRFGREEADPSLASHIESRKAITKEAQARGLYDQFMEKVGGASLLDAAEALYAIDQLAGFEPLSKEEFVPNTPIGTVLPSAFDAVFPKTATVAPERSFDLQKVAHYFGPSFATQLEKGKPGLVDSLSEMEKSILDTCTQ